MIQSRTQDDDLLFAQEPGKAISTHCESSDASGRAVPQGQNVKRNRGGGLNRIKPKTGKSAEKRRRRLERIRSNMLAEKAEKAADANTRSDSVAETKSIAAAAQPVVNPGPRFSEADLTPKRSRKRSKPKETADDPTVASSELSAFAAFEVSTKTPMEKTRVNSWNGLPPVGG